MPIMPAPPLRYPPLNAGHPHVWHGGDYNPDQWPPETVADDVRLMREAHVNVASVGIFSWVHLEPEEGRYTFDWLDGVFEQLHAGGVQIILATPSGSKPAWLSRAYPEVCRVAPDGRREPHGGRHNHCFTSPVYREKVRQINTQLARRYGGHPALVLWHLSNEYSGCCYCPLCLAAFHDWLRQRYGSLERLNRAWWSAFWSHDFTAWDQIAPNDTSLHGLQLDWKRFTTDRTIDFLRAEIAPLRTHTPGVPVTTNFMGTFPGLDYRRMARELDVVCWDNYPQFTGGPELAERAPGVAFTHDLNRSLRGGQPFLLMESSPSATNWQAVSKLKRPGVHRLEELQAVAHGADMVGYFQWRAGRGGCEKFHGAVVQHDGTGDTRVFRDVRDLGAALERLDAVVGTTVRPEVAVVFDWENRWALELAAGPRQQRRDYVETCVAHYRPFWRRGVPVDIVGEDDTFDRYRLVIAPMLYMVRPGVAERLEAFVRTGGTLVTTYWSGIVDENDLAFTTGRPGPLRALLGIWSEELDALHDGEANATVMTPGGDLGLAGEYPAEVFCDLIHAEGAQVLATYRDDFYAGRPALTVNRVGRGAAYYAAFRGPTFPEALCGALAARLGLARAVEGELPPGVSAQVRADGDNRFVFLLNFTPTPATVSLGRAAGTDIETGETLAGVVPLSAYGARVVRMA